MKNIKLKIFIIILFFVLYFNLCYYINLEHEKVHQGINAVYGLNSTLVKETDRFYVTVNINSLNENQKRDIQMLNAMNELSYPYIELNKIYLLIIIVLISIIIVLL